MPALAIRDLTGPAGAPELRGVSLDVPSARTNLVLGPIHAGKTMLMRLIVGLERAEHGTIEVDGEAFDASNVSDRVLRRIRTRIGVVFEGSALVSRISVIENVELPLLEHTGATAADAREDARALLAQVGLVVESDTMPYQLGRAAQRRVAIARALALRPAILLLDEPTLGLDAHAAAELDDTLTRLQESQGFGALIFSHEVRYAYGPVYEIFVMSDGAIVARGNKTTLRDDPHETVQQLLNRRGRR